MGATEADPAVVTIFDVEESELNSESLPVTLDEESDEAPRYSLVTGVEAEGMEHAIECLKTAAVSIFVLSTNGVDLVLSSGVLICLGPLAYWTMEPVSVGGWGSENLGR